MIKILFLLLFKVNCPFFLDIIIKISDPLRIVVEESVKLRLMAAQPENSIEISSQNSSHLSNSSMQSMASLSSAFWMRTLRHSV